MKRYGKISIPVYLHCDGCNKMHDVDDIYEFCGNVMHPCGGGYIGQNIFTGKQSEYDRKAEAARKIKILESKDGSVRICALRYCRNCCARIFGIKGKI